MDHNRRKVGNEFTAGGPRFLDLRAMANSPLVEPAARAIKQSITPPVTLNLKPVRLTKRQSTGFFDGLAYDVLFIAVAGIVASYVGYRDPLFGLYLMVALIFRVSSSRIFRSALLCLILVPILLQLKRTELADLFAVFTYYFLVIGVVRAVLELKRA